MADYRNPKVTTPTQDKSSVGRWIGIALAVIVALLLLAWLVGAFSNDNDTATAPVTTQEPAATTTEVEPADDVVITEEPAAGTTTTVPATTTTTPAQPTTEPIDPED